MEQWYDTSDLSPFTSVSLQTKCKTTRFLYIEQTNGASILEFIGLRAKMYSIRLGDGTTKMTAKGVDRGFMKKHIEHEQYRACLEKYTRITAQFKTIRSQRQELFTMNISKISLSPYDKKRYLLKDSHTTLADSHGLIPKK